jgi:hypothetical protein
MWKTFATVVAMLVWGAGLAASTPALVRTALADCRRQSPALQPFLRYLSLEALPPAERPLFLKALAFHVNSLSREAEVVSPRVVAEDLVVLNLQDYGWKTAVYDKLADRDPYDHVRLEKIVEEKDVQEVGYRQPGGGWVTTGTRPILKKVKKQFTAAAPWLPATEIAELIQRTQSQAPLLRADWFLVQTAIQVNRGGAGYYDFLGLKKRADVEKLVALDRQAAQRVRREVAAIIAESGVALNNRQVYRFQSVTGGYWETRDVNNNAEQRNALRVLNGDFVHDAEEIYGVLPNGLFVLAASNAQGVLQDTVPDSIAADRLSTSNDLRIHPGLSCIRCHVEGLRPLDDWARKFYQGDVKLQAVDYAKLQRLRQLYLGDLARWLRRDREDYAEALLKVNGLSPAENAQAYARVWQRYQDTPVAGAQLARELGLPEDRLQAALRQYAQTKGQLDVILLGYLKQPELPARREHIEEIFALAHEVVKGYLP